VFCLNTGTPKTTTNFLCLGLNILVCDRMTLAPSYCDYSDYRMTLFQDCGYGVRWAMARPLVTK
jgi:hypothetical protein